MTFNDLCEFVGANCDALIIDANILKDAITVQPIGKAAGAAAVYPRKDCGAGHF